SSTRAHASPRSGTPSRRASAPSKQARVEAELKQGRTVLVLFWDPKGTDDVAVRRELHALQALHGKSGLPQNRRIALHEAGPGAAGGAACGDLIRISLAIDPHSCRGQIHDAGFDASGCGALIAAGSAAVSLLRGAPLLAAARIGADTIAGELGGLSATKRHAAELAADALHRALGAAAREHVWLAV